MPQTDLFTVLERPYADTSEGALRFFIALVAALRPADPENREAAAASFAALRHIAAREPKHRATLKRRLQQHECLAGIFMVGFTNLAVSFALALWVALKARGADISSANGLAALLRERMRTAPAQFLVPPPAEAGAPRA